MRTKSPLQRVAKWSLILGMAACSAHATQDLRQDEFPEGFAPLPGNVPPAPPPHIGAALEALTPEASYVLCTNALAISVHYLDIPRSGRAARIEIVYSNLTAGAYHLFSPDDTSKPDGVRYFALHADGTRTLLRDEAYGVLTIAPRVTPHGRVLRELRLSPSLLNSVAGSEGLVVAYAMRMMSGWVLYAESAPLSVFPEPWQGDPVPLTQTEWHTMLTNWVASGQYPRPDKTLKDYPEFASFYPGVILDTTLPETFRLEFAKQMPGVDAYDPRVLEFIQNAPDKDAPLVIVALKILSRSGGSTPEENVATRADSDTVYAMSLDPQYPLIFRLHAAYLHKAQSWYKEFLAHSEPAFKLVCAYGIREYDIEKYTETKRDTIREGLQPLLSNTDPYDPGPLRGRVPENQTISQAAQAFLTEFETRWTANPPPE